MPSIRIIMMGIIINNYGFSVMVNFKNQNEMAVYMDAIIVLQWAP